MFCDYTKIEYQDHSEYFNLPISEELRRRAIEAFDSEFVLQLGQERQRSAATASQAVTLNSTEVDKLNELKKMG